jgi:excisionase family DNA binding protein
MKKVLGNEQASADPALDIAKACGAVVSDDPALDMAKACGAATSAADSLRNLYAAAARLEIAGPMLNANEVSALLGISKSYLCELTREGEILGAIRIGSLWRYRADALLEMITASGARPVSGEPKDRGEK